MSQCGVYRYHVQIGGRRTSVTLDTIVAGCLADKLGFPALEPGAFPAVREWLQGQLDRDYRAPAQGASRWLMRRAVGAVVRDELAPAVLIKW